LQNVLIFANGYIQILSNFDRLQERNEGGGVAEAVMEFLQTVKDSEIFIIFAYKKTKPYTQKGILPISCSKCYVYLYVNFIYITLNLYIRKK